MGSSLAAKLFSAQQKVPGIWKGMPRCVGCWLQCPEALEISCDNITPALDLGTTEAVAGSKNQVGEVVQLGNFSQSRHVFSRLHVLKMEYSCQSVQIWSHVLKTSVWRDITYWVSQILKFVEAFRNHAQGKGKILDILNSEFQSSWIFHQPIGSRWGTRDTMAFFFPLKPLEPLSLIMRQLSLKLDSDSDLRRWELDGLSLWTTFVDLFFGVFFQVDHKLRSLVRMSSLSLQSTIGKDTPQQN